MIKLNKTLQALLEQFGVSLRQSNILLEGSDDFDGLLLDEQIVLGHELLKLAESATNEADELLAIRVYEELHGPLQIADFDGLFDSGEQSEFDCMEERYCKLIGY